MASIKPFAALRPDPGLAARICELPYDVMSSEEARQVAVGNPLSFLHVSKPEIDLPPGTDLYAPEVYAKGRESFRRLIVEGALRQDPQPHFYFYRQVMGRHSQTGLVAAASCEDYVQGIIKKHELTRPDKEDDRLRHIEALESQTGPVFLVYRASRAIDALVAKLSAEAPSVDFTASDGVRHSAWVIADSAQMRIIEGEFAQTPCLYIADGHHRCAAAARVYQRREGAGESAYFLSVIFPHNQLQILPYNRVLRDLNGLSPGQLHERLASVFAICSPGPATPTRKHELGLYLAGQWHTLRFLPDLTPAGSVEIPVRPAVADSADRNVRAPTDPIEQLDVTLVQQHVLGPVFGITDPRTSQRLNFVGGIRGTTELEKLVNSGEYACAFSMFPTSIADLMTIADAGGIMPPKSTWFEPKLRDGMFCHMI